MTVFRTLFWSIKKSRRLQKIAVKLTPTPDGGESIIRAFTEGGFDALGPRLNDIEEGKRELFGLIREDPVTSKLLQDYEVDDKELDDLYNKLVRNGAGIYKRGHWIPASTLAFGQTLEYLLKNKDTGQDDFKKICYHLWQYFTENKTGEIEY
jgi:hypothetical protein